MSGIEEYRAHPASNVRAAQQGDPEAIFTWVRLSPDTIRLYASRNLSDLAWGQREKNYTVRWHLDGDLDHVLIVDRPTAAEAFQWVLERWAREDAEKEAAELERAERFRRHAIAGQAVSDPKAIISGLPGI